MNTENKHAQELDQTPETYEHHTLDTAGKLVGSLSLQQAVEAAQPAPGELESPSELYEQRFEAQRSLLEHNRQFKEDRLVQAQNRAVRMAETFQEKKGYPPSTEWLAGLTAGVERGLQITNQELEFLRPSSGEDIEYRHRIMSELPPAILEAVPVDLPLRFHGTPIYTARDIFFSKEISSSVDRLGVATSYDVGDQVSVTTPESIEVTLSGYTGLTEANYCVPAGCVFVLNPTTQEDIDAGKSMLMGNVDFAEHPEQLFAVMTSDENLEMVQGWAQAAGIDAGKIVEYFDFPSKVDALRKA